MLVVYPLNVFKKFLSKSLHAHFCPIPKHHRHALTHSLALYHTRPNLAVELLHSLGLIFERLEITACHTLQFIL